MDIDYKFVPWRETVERKRQALADYRNAFGEDAPESADPDARYLAAITAMISDRPASTALVRQFETLLKERHAH